MEGHGISQKALQECRHIGNGLPHKPCGAWWEHFQCSPRSVYHLAYDAFSLFRKSEMHRKYFLLTIKWLTGSMVDIRSQYLCCTQKVHGMFALHIFTLVIAAVMIGGPVLNTFIHIKVI